MTADGASYRKIGGLGKEVIDRRHFQPRTRFFARSVLLPFFIPLLHQLLHVFDHVGDDLLRIAVEHARVIGIKERVLNA
jgi:hypothetical protein